VEDTVSPTQLIRASEDKVLGHCVVANVVNDGTHFRPLDNKTYSTTLSCYLHEFAYIGLGLHGVS